MDIFALLAGVASRPACTAQTSSSAVTCATLDAASQNFREELRRVDSPEAVTLEDLPLPKSDCSSSIMTARSISIFDALGGTSTVPAALRPSSDSPEAAATRQGGTAAHDESFPFNQNAVAFRPAMHSGTSLNRPSTCGEVCVRCQLWMPGAGASCSSCNIHFESLIPGVQNLTLKKYVYIRPPIDPALCNRFQTFALAIMRSLSFETVQCDPCIQHWHGAQDYLCKRKATDKSTHGRHLLKEISALIGSVSDPAVPPINAGTTMPTGRNPLLTDDSAGSIEWTAQTMAMQAEAVAACRDAAEAGGVPYDCKQQ